MIVNQCFSDRLIEAVTAKKTPAVINIDPVFERLPREYNPQGTSGDPVDTTTTLDGIKAFSRHLIAIVAPLVPAVKFNIACFERYHASGIEAYDHLVNDACRAGLIVIGDIKRGDVGHTSMLYAQAHLTHPPFAQDPDQRTPDAVTINGYFGSDGVKPFIDVARDQAKGVFILVRTSNESAASVQDVITENGRKVHELVASLVARWAEESDTMGRYGFSSVGAVVAAKNPDDASRLRAAMPRSILLVPGYGAQGGRAEDYKPYFDSDGRGAIVAAGRSVIYAHQQASYREQFGDDWKRCVEHACRDFVTELSRVVAVH